MDVSDRKALQHCDLGLEEMWRGDADAALAQYERASAVAIDDETRELITIRKAEALIALDREGPEIAALPGIVMRHRSARHVYLAANTLQRHLCERDQRPRAIFYGGIARRARVSRATGPFQAEIAPKRSHLRLERRATPPKR